ncbi:unnamed protein product [Cylindrotheca closterium]|uniref:Uncharacterized protein n=1 Tax=Cylindrotheca closterium TaxID=2856 RepID=A0AAD2FMD1_9STRA|nr:unnamed protein product [Cylindrotheca closterium]
MSDLSNINLMYSLPMPFAVPQGSPTARQEQQLSLFTCNSGLSRPFLCQPTFGKFGYGIVDAFVNRLDIRNSSTSDLLYPVFFCESDAFVENGDLPSSDTFCDKDCVMVYSTTELGTEYCTSCALIGTDVVYDCRNLLNVTSISSEQDYKEDAVSSCASRNVDGDCGDYVHWECIISGLGYSCQNTNRRWLFEDFVFPYDDMLGRSDDFTVYCTTDITGLSLSRCENPACLIGNPDPFAYCASCTVLQNSSSPHSFAYDCGSASFQTWDLACPILDENGDCQEYVDPFNVSLTVTNENVKGMPSSSVGQSDEDEVDERWTWTIQNIDPTTLNVLADLFGFATRTFFGFAFAAVYPLIVTWQLGRYKKTIPLNHLGVVPGDVVQAFGSLPSMAWTAPAIAVALLLFVADFSHTIAMFGFDFIDEEVPGRLDTILRISTTAQDRNLMRSFISAGDPEQFRTLSISNAIKKGRIIEGREQTMLWESFFRSVGAIARAASPFVQVAIRPKRGTLVFGGFQYDTTYMPDDSAIVSMATEIPLICESSHPAIIEEAMTGGALDETVYNTAVIPNCTFLGIRPSGVFSGSLEQVEIVEKMSTPPWIAGFVGDEVQLKNGEELFYSFVLDHEQRKLARDRDDWKKGRTLDNVIDGIQIGNETIEFGRVVLASGNSLASDVTIGSGRKYYSLFAEIVGECPNRPSGLQSTGTQCLAIVRNECDSFPEDTDALYNKIYAPLTSSVSCEISEVTFIWGRNFAVDGELVSVVAGVYGQVRPTLNELRSFEENVIPAALFSLGVLHLAPTVASTVKAEVDIKFIVFLLLPIALGLAAALVAYCNRKIILPIPQTPWELMVVGKEEPSIPSRNKRSDPFPEMPDDLVLYFFDAKEDLPEEQLGSRIFRTSQIQRVKGRISLVDSSNVSNHSSHSDA